MKFTAEMCGPGGFRTGVLVGIALVGIGTVGIGTVGITLVGIGTASRS